MTADFDLVVVGGGIHGCGVAQAAAAAGHSVLVLEQSAVAHGTSSRSSKLIHGGLRYLEQLELGLVRECLQERRLLLRLAPSLVRLRPFVIPVYRHTTRRPWQVRLGLSAYSLLAGLRAESRFESVPRREWSRLDGLATNQLQAVFRYRDGQTDDAALTRAVLASARSLGAELQCPARFTGARVEGGGVEVRYEHRCGVGTVETRALVNAAGPWVNRVLDRVVPRITGCDIELVQGTHLLFEERVGDCIYYVEAPSDRRPLFVTPFRGGTLVGTTETPFRGEPGSVEPTGAECEYLLEAVARYFPALANSPVRESFAGVRVLPAGKGPANRRSRETVLHTDRRRRPTIVSIYGGKLTSYRATAERVLRRLRPTLPRRRRLAHTDGMTLEAAE